ncbi:MAG: ABC transporter permease subunit [Bacilli bacterium]|nr:ABC transporter permease subunit [Bacilli bacterium]
MKKYFINKYTLTVLGVLLFFAIWYVIYLIAGQSKAIFPSPIDTIKQAWIFLGDKYTYECIWGSLKRMLIGFAIAALAGFIVGALAGNYTKLKYVFNPTMIAIKTVPTAALIFVFLVLAGLKNAPIYMVSIIVFPMIYEATASGFQHVDKELVLAATLDSKSPLQIMSKIKFPLSFPYIALGLITSFSLSFKIEIMSEVISGSSTKGIGNAIQQAYLNSSNGLIPTFAYAFIAIALMLLVALLLSFVKKPLKNLA